MQQMFTPVSLNKTIANNATNVYPSFTFYGETAMAHRVNLYFFKRP